MVVINTDNAAAALIKHMLGFQSYFRHYKSHKLIPPTLPSLELKLVSHLCVFIHRAPLILAATSSDVFLQSVKHALNAINYI